MKTDNELIEDFFVSQGGKPSHKADIDFYESSLDMLMPVVEKIQLLGNDFIINSTIRKYIQPTGGFQETEVMICPAFQYQIEGGTKFFNKGRTLIEAIHKSVVYFIKKHNKSIINE